jgi:hypothetical protein
MFHRSAHKDLDNHPEQIKGPSKCPAASQGGCYCDGSCMRPKDEHQEKLLKDYIHRKQESDGFFK